MYTLKGQNPSKKKKENSILQNEDEKSINMSMRPYMMYAQISCNKNMERNDKHNTKMSNNK